MESSGIRKGAHLLFTKCLIFTCSAMVCVHLIETDLYAQNRKPNSRNQPNIILIMADDLGINEVGCYGSKVLKTPNIDALCRGGLKFNCAYSGSTVCAPARCILMTGQHAGACSVRVNSGGVSLPDRDVTIAEMLREVGYATGGFGKWALGVTGSKGDPLKQGFDEFYGYYHQTHAHSHYAEYIVDNGEQVRLEGNVGANLGYELDGLVSTINPTSGKKLEYVPYLLMERADQFIRKHVDRPFFCYLPLTVPHGHFHIPEDDPAAQSVKDLPWSDRAKAVAAMTQLLDQQVGNLMKTLKQLEIDENTIVIFCSDHGPALRFDGELDASGPFKGFKRSMYEGGLRIPLIVHWPSKIKPETQSDHVAYLGDLFATFREIACVDEKQDEAVDQMLARQPQTSVSFAPTMLGENDRQQQHEFLFWEFAIYNPAFDHWDKFKQALRKGKWKLVRHSEDESWELYDLGQDPNEQVNLAGEFPDRVKAMESAFFEERIPPARQTELMVDWMTPFTWENKDRLRRFPEPSLETIIKESSPEFKGFEFKEDAVMLGLYTQKQDSGLVQLNIAWQLKEGRREKRIIHVCDESGKIVRQLNANKTLFNEAKPDQPIVDSIVVTPEQLEGASFIAVGFYQKDRGTSQIINPDTGQRDYRLTVFRVEK